MSNSPQRSFFRTSDRRSMPLAAWAGVVLAALLLTPSLPFAQQKPAHVNPVIAKLAEGKTVYGLNTGDLSLVYARETARAPVDFAYADLEHNPLDFPALHIFLLGMSDRGIVLKKGNLQPNVALFARFPPEADQSQWVVKQALDTGLMGVSGENMSGTPTCGRSTPRATCWRCSLIESVEGLKNLDEIASVPGVGGSSSAQAVT